MIHYISPSGGVVALRNGSGFGLKYFDADNRWSDGEPKPFLSLLTDWQECIADEEQALARAEQAIWNRRCVSLCRSLLTDLSAELADSLIEEIDDLLKAKCSSELILAQLLIAPLAHPGRAGDAAQIAASSAIMAVAALFDEANSLQPLLKRLANAWLSLPLSLFKDFDFTPKHWWTEIANRGYLLKLLRAPTRQRFSLEWNNILFDTSLKLRASSRQLHLELGNRLSESCFIGVTDEDSSHKVDSTEAEPEDDDHVRSSFKTLN